MARTNVTRAARDGENTNATCAARDVENANATHADESASVAEHRARARGELREVGCAVLTVSDSRRWENDSGGALLAQLLTDAGHKVVARAWVADERDAIFEAARAALERAECEALFLTGGTGVAARDVTPEAIAPLLTRTLPGFGELFRMLSFQEVGAAALLSRALAGMHGKKLVVALPGSRAAIRTALEKLLLPELAHLLSESKKR